MFIECAVVLFFIFHVDTSFNDYIDLPPNHLQFYFKSFPSAIQYYCANNKECIQTLTQSQEDSNRNGENDKSCWGFESDCKRTNSFAQPHCPGDHTGWVTSKQIQIDTFFVQADFGYINQQQKEMLVMCDPVFADDSVLECSKNLRFCRGRNLMLNFTNLLDIKNPFRYKMDVLSPGQFGK